MTPFYISSWNLLCFTLTLTLTQGQSCWDQTYGGSYGQQVNLCYIALLNTCVTCGQLLPYQSGSISVVAPTNKCSNFPGNKCCARRSGDVGSYSYSEMTECPNTPPTGTCYNNHANPVKNAKRCWDGNSCESCITIATANSGYNHPSYWKIPGRIENQVVIDGHLCDGYTNKMCCALTRPDVAMVKFQCENGVAPCKSTCKLQSSCAVGTFYATDSSCTGASICGDKDGTCSSCAYGTYQNEPGQTECKDCMACSTGQYQIRSCTSTTNRICAPNSCWSQGKCYRSSRKDCVDCSEFKVNIGGVRYGRVANSSPNHPGNKACSYKEPWVNGGGYSYSRTIACSDYTPCNAVCKLQSSCAPGSFLATDSLCTGNSFCGGMDGTCKSCSIGTYQNEAGQTECKDCIACSTGQHQTSGCTNKANRICAQNICSCTVGDAATGVFCTTNGGVICTGGTSSGTGTTGTGGSTIDMHNNVPTWTFPTQNGITSSVISLDKTTIYFGSLDQYLYAIKISDGSMVWKYNIGDAIYSSPVLSLIF